MLNYGSEIKWNNSLFPSEIFLEIVSKNNNEVSIKNVKLCFIFFHFLLFLRFTNLQKTLIDQFFYPILFLKYSLPRFLLYSS